MLSCSANVSWRRWNDCLVIFLLVISSTGHLLQLLYPCTLAVPLIETRSSFLTLKTTVDKSMSPKVNSAPSLSWHCSLNVMVYLPVALTVTWPADWQISLTNDWQKEKENGRKREKWLVKGGKEGGNLEKNKVKGSKGAKVKRIVGRRKPKKWWDELKKSEISKLVMWIWFAGLS